MYPTKNDTSTRESPAVPRGLWLLGLLAALLMAIQAGYYVYIASGQDVAGSIGLKLTAPCDADRFCHVDAIKPQSPAGVAGIKPGDAVRYDRYWERSRMLSVGERVGLSVRTGGTAHHLTLIAAPRFFFAPTYMLAGTTNIVICGIALVLLWRAGRGWTGFLLAVALIAYALPGNYPRLWQNAPELYVPFLLGLSAVVPMAAVLMLLALRSFRRDVTGAVPRWLDRLIIGTIVAETLIYLWSMAVELNVAPLLGVDDGLSLLSIGGSAGAVLVPLALASGWQDTPVGSRTRYAFMWAAASMISVYLMIDPIIMLTGNNYVEASWPVITQIASETLGAVLFAYALLRHRVIDLGFAINRTLVFSSLSFIVLALFGLVEWATEKLLPFESHEASVIVDAAIALSLFLAFHRVHEWVERLVERVFFHQWHRNEKALHAFLGEAEYVTRPEVLAERAVTALSRFAGGADAALYRIDRGEYRLVADHGASGAATTIDADTPFLVTMRAGRGLVRDALAPGDLALPMTHRADVVAFVLMGPKPNGEPYRHDEESTLADAARRIGLDIQALRVGELELENSGLTARLDAVAA